MPVPNFKSRAVPEAKTDAVNETVRINGYAPEQMRFRSIKTRPLPVRISQPQLRQWDGISRSEDKELANRYANAQAFYGAMGSPNIMPLSTTQVNANPELANTQLQFAQSNPALATTQQAAMMVPFLRPASLVTSVGNAVNRGKNVGLDLASRIRANYMTHVNMSRPMQIAGFNQTVNVPTASVAIPNLKGLGVLGSTGLFSYGAYNKYRDLAEEETPSGGEAKPEETPAGQPATTEEAAQPKPKEEAAPAAQPAAPAPQEPKPEDDKNKNDEDSKFKKYLRKGRSIVLYTTKKDTPNWSSFWRNALNISRYAVPLGLDATKNIRSDESFNNSQWTYTKYLTPIGWSYPVLEWMTRPDKSKASAVDSTQVSNSNTQDSTQVKTPEVTKTKPDSTNTPVKVDSTVLKAQQEWINWVKQNENQN